MNFIIRKASDHDFPTIYSLIKELALFVNKPQKVMNSVQQMLEEKEFFQCIVAENDSNEIIGYAAYFYAYYTWVGKSLYLDDLYVKEDFRNQGIGTQLLKKIFEIAQTENCKRVRWQVLNWNKPAIEFYKKYGAIIDADHRNCDLNL